MKATVGNNLLAKPEVTGKQYEVRDDKLIGFLVRVNASGKKMFVCEYARGKSISIGKVGVLTPAQARDKAKQILADAARGVNPTQRKPNKELTLGEFIEKDYSPWLHADRQTAARSIQQLKSNFRNFLCLQILS